MEHHVGGFHIYLHKGSHHLVTLIHGFEEVVKILYMKICKTLQYLVNLPELASSFTTKELLRRNFAKSKVKGYTPFFDSTEQLFFRTISRKEGSCPESSCMFQISYTKTRRLVKFDKIYIKDIGLRLIDVFLVSLVLTLKIFYILFQCFYW